MSHQVGLQVSQALPRFGDPHPTEMSWSTVSWGHPACFAVAIPGKFPAPAIVERPQRAGGFSLFRAMILRPPLSPAAAQKGSVCTRRGAQT